MTEMIETTVFLQIRKSTNRWRVGNVVRHTSKRPEFPAPGAIVVKVRVKIPRAAFDPLEPEAVIEIPDDLVQHPVEVVAVVPD